jgi:hypothetical protein
MMMASIAVAISYYSYTEKSMLDPTKPDRLSDLDRDEDDDNEPLRLIDVVRAVGRRRNSTLWGPIELALQIHRVFNKHLLIAQKEMFELEIKYVNRLISADEAAERRDQNAAPTGGHKRKKLAVDG